MLRIIIYLCLSAFFTAVHLPGIAWEALALTTIAGFVVAGLAVAKLNKTGRASPIDKAMMTFLGLVTAGIWLQPETLGPVVTRFPATLLYTVMLIWALAPAVLAGHYFTIYFAKQTTPEPLWETDIFITINRHMTYVWSGIFLLCGLIAGIPSVARLDGPVGPIILQYVLPILLLSAGGQFNKWYPDHYLRGLGLEPISSMMMDADD